MALILQFDSEPLVLTLEPWEAWELVGSQVELASAPAPNLTDKVFSKWVFARPTGSFPLSQFLNSRVFSGKLRFKKPSGQMDSGWSMKDMELIKKNESPACVVVGAGIRCPIASNRMALHTNRCAKHMVKGAP